MPTQKQKIALFISVVSMAMWIGMWFGSAAIKWWMPLYILVIFVGKASYDAFIKDAKGE